MLKVAITGGIGSGKTLVASLFKTLGIPVYEADTAAKQLMDTHPEIRSRLIALFGEQAYREGRLDKAFLASRIFSDVNALQKVNAIVHPVTIADSQEWFTKQQTPYAIKEAAILFESGSDRYVDYIIGVTASETLRIQRTMERSHISEAMVRARMLQQMDEAEKMRRCHYVIDNNGSVSLIEQVITVHEQLLKQAQAGFPKK